MKRLLYIFLAACFCGSCVHQFPDETTLAQLDVTLTFETEMDFFRTMHFPDDTRQGLTFEPETDHKPDYFDQILPDQKTGSENYRIRYVIEAYRILSNGRTASVAEERKIFYDDASQWDDYSFSLTLPEGGYELRVWADYIDKESDAHLFYDPTNFSGIRLNLADGHHVNTDYRDAFVGRSKVELVRYGSIVPPVHTTVVMGRPMGKYVFVSSDLDEFVTKVLKNQQNRNVARAQEVNLEDYKLIIQYPIYMPSSFSMKSDRHNSSASGVIYESTLKALDDSRAVMGFDYVFTNPRDVLDNTTRVNLKIILQDKQGNVLAAHEDVYISLRRNMMTVVEGSFLVQDSDGGVSIDPGFNGPDIIVPVN